MSIASQFSAMPAREKRMFIGVIAVFVLNLPPTISITVEAYNTVQRLGGWERIRENHKLLQAEANAAPPMQAQATPGSPPGPRPLDPGGSVAQSMVYWAANQTHMAKPAMQCPAGTQPRPVQFLANTLWKWSYRDLGDRWEFAVDGPPGAVVYIWPTCAPRGAARHAR